MAINEASKEDIHLDGFLHKMEISGSEAVTFFNDNAAAIKLTTNQVLHIAISRQLFIELDLMTVPAIYIYKTV